MAALAEASTVESRTTVTPVQKARSREEPISLASEPGFGAVFRGVGCKLDPHRILMPVLGSGTDVTTTIRIEFECAKPSTRTTSDAL